MSVNVFIPPNSCLILFVFCDIKTFIFEYISCNFHTILETVLFLRLLSSFLYLVFGFNISSIGTEPKYIVSFTISNSKSILLSDNHFLIACFCRKKSIPEVVMEPDHFFIMEAIVETSACTKTVGGAKAFL